MTIQATATETRLAAALDELDATTHKLRKLIDANDNTAEIRWTADYLAHVAALAQRHTEAA